MIQPYSGHSSRQSLEVYSRLSIGDAQEVYEQVLSLVPYLTGFQPTLPLVTASLSLRRFKTFPVFNIEQCEGINIPELIPLQLDNNQLINNCEQVINNFTDKPECEISISNIACYIPSQDIIKMPTIKQFISSEKYYCTFFHELAHSTGHKSRLNRRELNQIFCFGDKDYAKEELIAEMTACFLCSEVGIENQIFDNSVSYINGWLSVLKKKPNWLLQSAGTGQKAADYILQKQP